MKMFYVNKKCQCCVDCPGNDMHDTVDDDCFICMSFSCNVNLMFVHAELFLFRVYFKLVTFNQIQLIWSCAFVNFLFLRVICR